MFLNPASTSIFNENKSSSSSSSSFRRSSSSNENAAPLGMKTPHNNVKSHGSTNNIKKSSTYSGQTKTNTMQRRRRALGDISNKGSGSGSAAKGGAVGKNSGASGGLVVKPLSSVNRISNGSNKNRQVKFSKSGGVKNGKSSTSSKSQSTKQRSSSTDYDGVFGVTTRWSNTDLDYGRPTPLSQIPKEEFDMASNAAEEIRHHRHKERLRKEEAQERKMEEVLRMKKDVFDARVVEDDLQEALWELKISPAWEEDDDEEFDPTNERRLSGTDPVSLWGDILSP